MRSASRNLAIGPLASPSASATQPRPGAPRLWAKATIWSKKLRGRPTAPGAGTARTTAPRSIAPANTLKPEPRNTSVTSAISYRVAQVRLVGAVAQQGVGEGDARERGRRHLPVGELGEQAVHHRLDGREHVLLGDEAHLDVELVEFARAAVGAGVLVAKAGCDLEVPVEAGDHVELLVLLRRLRQGVEPARMQPRRHQEVARTLGRRRGQDRRLELGEALLDACGGGCSR